MAEYPRDQSHDAFDIEYSEARVHRLFLNELEAIFSSYYYFLLFRHWADYGLKIDE